MAVLAVLLFWPPNQADVQTRPPPRPPPTQPPKLVKPATQPTAPSRPAATGPARLTVKGIPDSRVLLEFKDIGYIQPNGELSFDVPSPGTAE